MPDKQPDTLESLNETIRTMQLQYEEVCEFRDELVTRPSRSFRVHDVLRIPHYETVGNGRYRVWLVAAVNLGGTNQEGTYHLQPLDVLENEHIEVPCVILETHREVELVSRPPNTRTSDRS